MDAYLILLLVACIVSTICATAILARDPQETSIRLSAFLLYGTAFWAACEILWNQTDNGATALALVKLSTLGWVAIGPLGLHMMVELAGEHSPRYRQLIRALYAGAAVLVAVDWLTPWIHSNVVKTPWGWGYEFGPGYAVYYGMTIFGLIAGLGRARRAYRRWPSQAERGQAKGIGVGILFPLCVASLTDALMPSLGIQIWHFGQISIAIFGCVIAWTYHRYGHSLLAPGTFAREILQTMPDGLALLHLDGRVRRANQGLLTLLGCANHDDLVGRDIREHLPDLDIHPDPDPHEVECRLDPLDGPPFPVSVSIQLLSDRGDQPVGLVIIMRDLREMVSLRQRLMLSGRMAAVGELSAGIAHEINNPMAYVRANLSLLREHWNELEDLTRDDSPESEKKVSTLWAEGRELLDESLEGVDRTSSIVRDIKRFSHMSAPEQQEVNLNHVLDTALRIASPQLRHRARVRCDYATVPPVRCAPREIEQVFLNLILNAADASEGDAEIRIATRSNAEVVEVEIEDDGSGISIEDLDRIFDPFFTTKPVGKGTGLGLALSYEIIRRHAGDIQVQSAPGEGARFTLTLPIVPPGENPD